MVAGYKNRGEAAKGTDRLVGGLGEFWGETGVLAPNSLGIGLGAAASNMDGYWQDDFRRGGWRCICHVVCMLDWRGRRGRSVSSN